MTLRLGGDGAITGCTSLENPDLTVSGLTISGSFDAEKVLVASGTAAAPSYTFSGDTDNGLYYAGTNSIGVSTAGTSAIIVDSSSRVLIGDTSVFANANADDVQIGATGTTNVGLTIGSSTQGQIAFADSGDARAGLIHYQHTDNSMRFYTAGPANERLRIDSSGNVGIGTSSPGYKLDVTSQLGCTYSGALRHLVNIDSDGGKSYWYNGSASSTAYILGDTGNAYFAGNVGVGTSSPSVLLHIAATEPQFYIQDSNSTGNSVNATLQFRDSSNTQLSYFGYASGSDSHFSLFNTMSGGDLRFGTASTERMRIDSSGNVGIGTTSVDAPFHVKSGSSSGAVIAKIEGATGEYFQLGISGTQSYFGTYNNSPLTFYVNNSERMRIQSDGDVLIGRTSNYNGSGEVLAVQGTKCAGVFFMNTNVDNPTLILRNSYADNNSNNATGRQIVFADYGGTVVGTITSNGSSTAYNTSSDYRLKENVVSITDGITRVKQLNPSRFNFIADPNTTVDGFLAHEAQAVVPEAITGTKDEVDDDGNPVYQGIDQSKLVPLLTAALQEAIAKIETLEQRLTDAGL